MQIMGPEFPRWDETLDLADPSEYGLVWFPRRPLKIEFQDSAGE
jgi:hypothetical protein